MRWSSEIVFGPRVSKGIANASRDDPHKGKRHAAVAKSFEVVCFAKRRFRALEQLESAFWMGEKRSSGWAGRRDSKSLFADVTDVAAPSPKRRTRSFLKPGMAVSYIYATVVMVVWQLWPRPPDLKEEIHSVTVKPGDRTEAVETISKSHERNENEKLKEPEKDGDRLSKDTEAEVKVANTMSRLSEAAVRAQLPLIGNVIPGGSIEAFQAKGRQFDVHGEHLDASWGWLYEGTSGLVGDQRKEATKGFVPSALNAYGATIGWQSLFEFSWATGEKVTSKDCSLVRSAKLSSRPGAAYALDLIGGEALELRCPKLFVQWTGALLRLASGGEALRTRILYTTDSESRDSRPLGLTVWDFNGTHLACGGGVSGDCLGSSGEVDGSPLIDPGRGMWIAMEHPRAACSVSQPYMRDTVCH